ncbi:MAG TPA: redoxin domain-containing protein [Bacteroidia bacterium]|nr:redoxin domain-containing protein [Bacteroidia bacterium]
MINFLSLSLCAVNGYKITLKSNVKNRPIYMYYQYGENRYARDTSITNGEGIAVFESDEKLTGGVFLVYLTNKKAFEFLMTDESTFSLSVDTADIMGSIAFTDSKENTTYYDFLKKYKFNEFQMQVLEKRLHKKSTRQDSISILKNLIIAYQKQLIQFKKQTIAKNPNTFVAHLIQASQPIEAPANLTQKAKDIYLKKHFLDNINFSDDKLAYSNVLYINYTNYINDCGFPETDSVIACCDTILQRASVSKDVFKWSLYFLGNSFERSSVQGQDKIFVHLVDEYYKKDRSWWLTDEQLKKIYKRSDVLKRLFVGNVCPNFTATDSAGKDVDLHQQITKTTVLYFWSYDCKHCLEETPNLAAWIKKHPEVNLITACLLPDEDEWKEKLKQFKLPSTHLIDTDRKANYMEMYSITSTPQIFVLSKDKKILAKYISDTKELDEFLKTKNHKK